MDPLVARGFVTLLLAPNQIKAVKAIELNLPPGRYLQAFEIVQKARLTPDPIPEQREGRMKEHLDKWQAENWKKNQMEDKTHEKTCSGVDRKRVSPDDLLGWCKCRTTQQEIHEWMDYVGKHWQEPLPKPGTGKLSAKIKFQTSDAAGTSKAAKKAAKRYEQSDLGDVSEVREGME